MNPFTAHPQRQGITYLDHWIFAMGIAYRLLVSVVAFALHAMLPFVRITPELDLESTAAYLAERNRWVEAAGTTVPADTRRNFAVSGPHISPRRAFLVRKSADLLIAAQPTGDDRMRQSALSGLAPSLAAHLERSSSNRSTRYAFRSIVQAALPVSPPAPDPWRDRRAGPRLR